MQDSETTTPNAKVSLHKPSVIPLSSSSPLPALPPSLPSSISQQKILAVNLPSLRCFLQLLPQCFFLPSLLLLLFILLVQIFLNKFGDGLGCPLCNAGRAGKGGRQGGREVR